MRFWGILAVVTVCVCAGPAQAKSFPAGGVTAEEIAAVLRGNGYVAEITKDQYGDPLINSSAQGIKFGVWFYNCDNNRRCGAIQLSTGFTRPSGLADATLNEWDRDNRYARAYFDREGNPFVEIDIEMSAGSNSETVERYLQIWNELLPEFTKKIGYQQ